MVQIKIYEKLLSLSLLLLFVISCSRENSGVILSPEGIAQPRSASIYCRTNNSLLSEILYSYKNGSIIYEKQTNTEPLRSVQEKFYEYNSQNQLVNIKSVYQSINDDGSVNNRSEYNMPREYKDNLLFKEFMDASRQSYYLYSYKNGSLVTKSYYDKNGLQGVTSFSYENGLLSQEFSSAPGSSYSTLMVYEYDSQKRLTKVKARQNNQELKVVAEYFYGGDKLFRKETYAWGIDPCFDICCGNWTYEYNY